MKLILTSVTASAILAFNSLAAPTTIKYGPPPGGWETADYPEGTGENLHEYPAPPGGWEIVDYPDNMGENPHEYPAPNGEDPPYLPPVFEDTDSGKEGKPFIFTITYIVIAKSDQVRNGTTPAPGAINALGYFNFGIDSVEDTLCYTEHHPPQRSWTYQSPAKSATHIHEASRGASGPPRLAFPNSVGDDKRRVSVGCLTGPFTTGLNGTDGLDTGTGFMVKQIEEDPAAFFADSHTSLFSLGWLGCRITSDM